MTSLLRMSEQEMAKQEQGLAPRAALVTAGSASVLALGGMMFRYAPGEPVPITGMDHFSGQVALAALLGVLMLVAAYLVRSVFMKRLQWAVLLSLLIHFIICVGLRTVVVDVPLAALADAGATEITPREFTIPDYGGAESQTAEQQWQQPSDTEVPESEQHQLDRQTAEVTPDAEPEQFETERRVETAATPDRQQQAEEMQRAVEMEMQRQRQQAQSDAPDQVQAPQVRTAQADQPNLEARQMNRQQSNPQNSQREMSNVESQVNPQVRSAQVNSRSEVQPQRMNQVESADVSRSAAAASAAETTAEAVEMSAAAEAPRLTAEARSTDTARQTQSELSARQPDSSTAPSSAASRMQVQSRTPSRSSASSQVAVSAPSGGGSASMQRSTSSNSRNTSAAGTSAQSVNVTSAGGAGTPTLNAAANAEMTRGSSSVPVGSAGSGGAPAVRLSRSGVSSLQSGSVGRSRGSQSGGGLGNAVSAQFSGGSAASGSARGLPGAVGTRAGEVSVQSAGAGGGSSSQVLAGGPSAAASGTARRGSGLPNSGGSGPGTGSAPQGTSGSGRSVAMNTVGRGGLSGGSTGRSARLQGNIAGSGSGSGSGSGRLSRGSGTAASLPFGALEAEQSGALVIAGPQAPAAGRSGGGGSLSGPRIASVPRRSAGLPGSGRASVSVGRPRAGLPGGLSSSGLTGRRTTGGSRPKIAGANQLAGMIRRAVPGISDIPTERINAAFSMRTPEAREEAVENLGGNDQSEAAVDRGLEWLAAHQTAAGNWSIHEMHCRDHDCGGHGSYDADPAATGMALLVFLGAGHTHKSGEYSREVEGGLNWLLNNQASNGDLFAAETEFARFYSHGIAAIALCEAYGMTKDARLRAPAQNALNYIVNSQHPEFGGWRYKPRFESDTSVSGWQLMALKSGEMAGLDVPAAAYTGVRKWLDSVEQPDAPGRFRYHPTKSVTDAMTAEGLLMRQYLGAGRSDNALQAGAAYLQQRLPRLDDRNAYYWYYGTQVMFHMQGEHWENWNAVLRDTLVDSQSKGGHTRGSWDPDGANKDTWGKSGGRHYVTCLNLLMLEVYYRHLPLYIKLNP